MIREKLLFKFFWGQGVFRAKIFRQAKILAGKQGVRTVISGAVLNINELNLTPQLIKIL